MSQKREGQYIKSQKQEQQQTTLVAVCATNWQLAVRLEQRAKLISRDMLPTTTSLLRLQEVNYNLITEQTKRERDKFELRLIINAKCREKIFDCKFVLYKCEQKR